MPTAPHGQLALRTCSAVARRQSLAALLVAVLGLARNIPVHAEESGALRASYVFNLSKFVDWPTTAFDADPQHFNVCVQGDEILTTFTSTLVGKVVAERPVVVTPLARHPKGRACQVLFINRSEIWRMADVTKEVAEQPLLTMSDGGAFAQAGGMIELMPEDSRLVFEINRAAIERTGLSISSKVLALARKVYR